jgi:hypothetical protein
MSIPYCSRRSRQRHIEIDDAFYDNEIARCPPPALARTLLILSAPIVLPHSRKDQHLTGYTFTGSALYLWFGGVQPIKRRLL